MTILDQAMYRVPEAAKVLKIGTRQVYNLLASRDLASVRVGRSRRVRGVDLAAFIDNLHAD